MEIKGKGRQDDGGDGYGDGDGEMQIKPRSSRKMTIIVIKYMPQTVFRQNLYLRLHDYPQCNNTSNKHQCSLEW